MVIKVMKQINLRVTKSLIRVPSLSLSCLCWSIKWYLFFFYIYKNKTSWQHQSCEDVILLLSLTALYLKSFRYLISKVLKPHIFFPGYTNNVTFTSVGSITFFIALICSIRFCCRLCFCNSSAPPFQQFNNENESTNRGKQFFRRNRPNKNAVRIPERSTHVVIQPVVHFGAYPQMNGEGDVSNHASLPFAPPAYTESQKSSAFTPYCNPEPDGERPNRTAFVPNFTPQMNPKSFISWEAMILKLVKSPK